MIRFYGRAPYRTLVLHGGPGAIGSLKGFARELALRSSTGIAEPLQAEYSVAGQLSELFRQTEYLSAGRLILIGHSWGAYLAALFAQKYPARIQKLISIGCPPLKECYAQSIPLRRTSRFSAKEQELFKKMTESGNPEKLSALLEHTDNYSPQNAHLHRADKVDMQMMSLVWSEAAQMRREGKILSCFQALSCELTFIFGKEDPHPAQGVALPLQEAKVPFKMHILNRCGHNPFMERYAREEFYACLLSELSADKEPVI